MVVPVFIVFPKVSLFTLYFLNYRYAVVTSYSVATVLYNLRIDEMLPYPGSVFPLIRLCILFNKTQNCSFLKSFCIRGGFH